MFVSMNNTNTCFPMHFGNRLYDQRRQVAAHLTRNISFLEPHKMRDCLWPLPGEDLYIANVQAAILTFAFPSRAFH